MKSLKYEGVVKLKIFWSLRRLEAGLNGFRIKRVHYGKFGLQIIREPPNFSKPNAPLPLLYKNPSDSLLLLTRKTLPPLFIFFVSSDPSTSGYGELQRRSSGVVLPPQISSSFSSFIPHTSLFFFFRWTHGKWRRKYGKDSTFLAYLELCFHFSCCLISVLHFSISFSFDLRQARWFPATAKLRRSSGRSEMSKVG